MEEPETGVFCRPTTNVSVVYIFAEETPYVVVKKKKKKNNQQRSISGLGYGCSCYGTISNARYVGLCSKTKSATQLAGAIDRECGNDHWLDG